MVGTMTDEIPGVFDLLVVIVVLSFVLLLLSGFLLNSLFLLLFILCKKLKTITNIYIFNLSLLQEIHSIGIVPLVISFLRKGTWPKEDLHCKVYFIFSTWYRTTIPIFLLALLADRFHYLRYGHLSHSTGNPKWRSAKIATKIVLGIWALSILSSSLFLPFVIYSVHNSNSTKIPCFLWSDTDAVDLPELVHVLYMVHSFVLGFAIPILPTIAFYIWTKRQLKLDEAQSGLREAMRLTNINEEEENYEQSDQHCRTWTEDGKSREKATRLVLSLVEIHLLCWVPYWIIFTCENIIPAFMPDEFHPSIPLTSLKYFTQISLILNAAINPFIFRKIYSGGGINCCSEA